MSQGFIFHVQLVVVVVDQVTRPFPLIGSCFLSFFHSFLLHSSLGAKGGEGLDGLRGGKEGKRVVNPQPIYITAPLVCKAIRPDCFVTQLQSL